MLQSLQHTEKLQTRLEHNTHDIFVAFLFQNEKIRQHHVQSEQHNTTTVKSRYLYTRLSPHLQFEYYEKVSYCWYLLESDAFIINYIIKEK